MNSVLKPYNQQQPGPGRVVALFDGGRRIVEAQRRIEESTMPNPCPEGRDEMNLAEFPLCALAHRLRPDQKTLQFEDRVWDERRRETVVRQLTITGADAYGLPTALDDEVLLGLIQLSRLQQFADRTVPFTRYRLIQLLGWRQESKSYERIEASLNRWTGVTLSYRNSWWNKARQCWVDEKFHVLDNVRLHHREPNVAAEPGEAVASVFVWNEVLFRSFQAGNLKSLDFDFFRELRSAIARRLYRFLDKRFFHRHRWEFDLRELACEHAGLSRGYDTANLRRKLQPGIAELEQRGYLRACPPEDRFRKICCGEWRVVFQKADGKASPEPAPAEPPDRGCVAALVQRGVAPATARELGRSFPEPHLRTQLEVFDWLVAKHDPKVSRNPPGFLVGSIRDDYAPPKAFLAEVAQRQKHAEATARREQERGQGRARAAARAAQLQARAEAIRRFWETLTGAERTVAEREALDLATGLQRRMLERGGSLGAATLRSLREGYALRRLKRP